MPIGAVQLLVVGFPTDQHHPELRAEVERLPSQPGTRDAGGAALRPPGRDRAQDG